MKKTLILGILLILLPAALAQCPATGGDSGCSIDPGDIPADDDITIEGHHITFERPQQEKINQELTLTIKITKDGQPVTGQDIQGQIIDPGTLNELFFGQVTETTPGTYQMTWKPSFAGTYYLQYIYRDNDTVIKPLFQLDIIDPRANTIFYALLAAGIISALIGGYLTLSKKKKNWKPLAYGLIFGLILLFLGYSVKVFYESGGERGFVVCGKDGCDLAIHWHTQLYMEVCGEDYHLPLEAGSLDDVHTHKERDYLHFHSLVKSDQTGQELLEPEKLHIGRMFDQIDVTFTDECFAGYCNGDKCPDGSVGTLRMTVNGVPNDKFDEYSYNDGDQIRITFGP